jgi:hypothetical protein
MEVFIQAEVAEAEGINSIFPTVEETMGRGLLGEIAVAVATMDSTTS